MSTPESSPVEIFKHCFKCARETLHARVPKIGRLLYACACGAPAREVSEPERSTAEAKRLVEVEANALAANVAREKKQAPAVEPPKRKWTRRTQPMPKAKPVAAPPPNPFLSAVDRRVDARLAAFKAELGPAIAAEIAKLLDDAAPVSAPAGAAADSLVALPAGFACPRAPHCGPHRRKCVKAFEAAA